MANWFKALDRAIYRAELAFVVVAMIAMAVLVFFDVCYRQWMSPESKVVELLVRIRLVGAESGLRAVLERNSTWLTLLFFAAVFWLGVRTASRRPLWPDATGARPERPGLTTAQTTLVAAAALGGAIAGLLLLFGVPGHGMEACEAGYRPSCGLFPNGVIWAQPFALILTVWVGFIGASMAAADRRHLKVEAVQRYLPGTAKRASHLLGALLTCATCLFFAYLAAEYVGKQYDAMVLSEDKGGRFEGTEIPLYQVFAILPVAFGLMAIRFLASGIAAWFGEIEDTPAELGNVDFEELGRELAAAEQAALAEAEVRDARD